MFRQKARLSLCVLFPGTGFLCVCLSVSVPALQAEGKDKSADDQPAFLVLPYLQLPAPNSMTVMWETNQKLPSRVEFGLTKELDAYVELQAPVILHEVPLRGLKAGTGYFYRVRSGELVSELYTFKTAPPPGTKRWRMAVYGDSRSNPATHKKVVEQIAKAGVDLIVHTGDIVLNGKKHDTWRVEFFEPLNPLGHSVPWVSTIGNHESDSDNYFSYMALPGNERFFGFDYANAHIICLDSNGWIEKGRDSKQYDWLSHHLREKRAATWSFIAFHHPLFSAHATRPINKLRWDWTPLFLDPENRVDGVLTGHDHFYAHNFRMGRLAAEPQPGVLFLTTAGGGASLYRSKARDYVAKEKSVHHFTLFDFDDDRITISAIDITGNLIDRFQMTKAPTPAEEFCAYEVEELRQFLRLALSTAPAIHAQPRADSHSPFQVIDSLLRVPTRFRVPVRGQLVWQDAPKWKLKHREVPFDLQPGQPLDIPLQAEIEPGDYARTPGVSISFEPGRFHNRIIELYPFKLAGPPVISARQTVKAPVIDGQLDDECWDSHKPEAGSSQRYPLLGLSPGGGRTDRIQIVADREWLYVGAKLDDIAGKVEVLPNEDRSRTSRLILFGEHVRLLVWDGKEMHTFALSPEQIRYATAGSKEDRATTWRALAARQYGSWTAEFAIPRSLLHNLEDVRVNFVHHRRDGKEGADFELCPTYGMGTDPDILPDWKPAENATLFGHLVID